MKNTKRFAAMIAALTLSACSIAPMFTSAIANGETIFTMDMPSDMPTGSSISTVSAIKIFETSYNETQNTLTVTGWANGLTASDIVAQLSDGTLKTAINATDGSAVAVAALLDNTNADEFAKAVALLLENNSGSIKGTYSANDKEVTFDNNLADGYYVVLANVSAGGSSYTSVSLGMLTVAGNKNKQIGNGTAKIGLPTVEKKVQENQTANYPNETATHEKTSGDKSWNDVADYNIGDAVPFKLYGTLPSDLANYGSYYYEFQDKLDKQFTAPTASDIVIKVGDKTVDTANSDTDIFINVDSDKNTINIIIEDIKKLKDTASDAITLSEDSVITVEYKAVLNENAKVGAPGQENKVKLVYSSNPNENYIPSNDTKEDTPDKTGETPEDKVIVYTYAVEIDKKFFNAVGDKLTVDELKEGTYEAVKFNLKQGDSNLKFSKYTGDDGAYDYVVDKNGNITDLTLTETGGIDGDLSTKADNNLVIRIKGLDEGTYTLVESAGPDGFNLAANQTLEIIANTGNTQTWDGTKQPLASFTWTVNGNGETDNKIDTSNDKNKATAILEVQNKKGASLPSTGGIGTTMFYLGGGCMVAVAGIFLISKKRMGKQEN